MQKLSGANTTIGNISHELDSCIRDLDKSRDNLSAEIRNIDKSIAEIAEERTDLARKFINNILPELTGESFDTLAGLAQGVKELSGQGLAFTRDKMLKARDEALAKANAILSETVDVDGFNTALATLQQAYDNAEADKERVDAPVKAAQTALDAWNKTPEQGFVALNAEIQAKGAPAISPDNRAYYDQTNLFKAMYNYVTRDASYRAVRRALVKYDHGDEGRDVFADMAAHTQKTQTLTQAVADAKSAAAPTLAVFAKAEASLESLASLKPAIKTDGEILAGVQAKAVTYMETPEFLAALSQQYGEDLPQSLPLLSAKVTTLEKLKEGAESKLELLSGNIASLEAQARRTRRYDSDMKVPMDIDILRRQNAARRAQYDNYTTATNESWNRTRRYSPGGTVVYNNTSPNIFEWMLISEILNDNRHRNDNRPSLAPYSADMLGVDKHAAQQAGVNIPDSSFDFSVDDNTGSTGAFDFDTSDLDRHLAKAFDFADAEVERAQEAAQEAARQRAAFDFNTSSHTTTTETSGGFDFNTSNDSSPSIPDPTPSNDGGGFDFNP